MKAIFRVNSATPFAVSAVRYLCTVHFDSCIRIALAAGFGLLVSFAAWADSVTTNKYYQVTAQGYWDSSADGYAADVWKLNGEGEFGSPSKGESGYFNEYISAMGWGRNGLLRSPAAGNGSAFNGDGLVIGSPDVDGSFMLRYGSSTDTLGNLTLVRGIMTSGSGGETITSPNPIVVRSTSDKPFYFSIGNNRSITVAGSLYSEDDSAFVIVNRYSLDNNSENNDEMKGGTIYFTGDNSAYKGKIKVDYLNYYNKGYTGTDSNTNIVLNVNSNNALGGTPAAAMPDALTLSNGGTLAVGYATSSEAPFAPGGGLRGLTVSNGGRVSSSSALYFAMPVTSSDGSTLLFDCPNQTVTLSAPVGGSVSFDCSKASKVVFATGFEWNSTGTLELGSVSLNVAGDGSSVKEFIFKNGSIKTTGDVNIGIDSSAQCVILNVVGSELDAGNVCVGQSGVGMLYITDGGVVKANKIQRGQTAPAGCKIFMDGGKIVAKQNNEQDWYFASLESVTLGKKGGIFDTNGHNIRFRAFRGFDGMGSFTKCGDGKLSMTSNEFSILFNYNAHGKIIVEQGTFELLPELTIYCEGVEVSEGATLNQNGAKIYIIESARWTNAAGDGDVANSANWKEQLRDYNQGDRSEMVVDGFVPTENTPIVVPYPAAAHSFDGFFNVTWVVDENAALTGYSVPSVLAEAAAWYDPSDASTLEKDGDCVVGIKNKGTVKKDDANQVDLDLAMRTTEKRSAPSLSTDGFNGRQAIYFGETADEVSGFKSEGYFPAGVPANGERAMFAVAKGDVNSMVMLMMSQGSTWSEEGRSILLAFKKDQGNYGCAYKVGYYNGTEWKAGRASFDDVVSNKPYVFSGRTARVWGDEDARDVESSAMDCNKAVIGSKALFNMPDGSNARFNVYYGSFELPVLENDTNGYQGEALIFTNALNDTQMAQVNEYLRAKWLDAGRPAALPKVSTIVANAQVDLGGVIREFTNISGSGSLVNGTVVLNGDLEVTVNANGTVVAPSFDKLVLGPSARIVVNGAQYLSATPAKDILSFTSLEGQFASVVSDNGAKLQLQYATDRVKARRDVGVMFIVY